MQIPWKKFPIILSEKGLGLLGIGSMLKNNFNIGESRKALKKLAAKNYNLRMILMRPNRENISPFLWKSYLLKVIVYAVKEKNRKEWFWVPNIGENNKMDYTLGAGYTLGTHCICTVHNYMMKI
jgi:hypothetical protein